MLFLLKRIFVSGSGVILIEDDLRHRDDLRLHRSADFLSHPRVDLRFRFGAPGWLSG